MSPSPYARGVKNVFDPTSKEPFRLSRSKIELFLNCARCFYLDRRLGVSQPPSFPFTLNAAVDTLLKKEFDIHRAQGTAHPLMKTYGIDAVPLPHERIEEWRDALRRGITHHHAPTNFIVTGAIDDVWVNSKGEFHIVDYKSTAKEQEVNIDAAWQIAYKRQMEIYQWLFRKNGFKVSSIGYFVYCNGIIDRKAFDGKLEFNIKIIPYEGDDGWVEEVLYEIHRCLESNTLPPARNDCSYCAYRSRAARYEA
ncbi:MAG: PD-(D/E)XK nuclease family protein [Patescibacteria group bacterium]